MEAVAKVLVPVEKVFVKNVAPVLNNGLVTLIISWIVIINVVHSTDSLPDSVKDALLHPVTKVASLILAIFYATGDMGMAITTTIGLVLAYKLFFMFQENFDMITLYPSVYPGCVDTKVSDLLELFSGDALALKKAMYNSGVPLQVQLTDENSPKIATYLVNYGHKVSQSCQAPI